MPQRTGTGIFRVWRRPASPVAPEPEVPPIPSCRPGLPRAVFFLARPRGHPGEMLWSPIVSLLAASVITAAPDPCPVPADLLPDGSANYVASAAQAADLAPSLYRPPDRISLPLRLYLPPPAPFGTEAELGSATLDLTSGAVAFDSRGRGAEEGGRQATPPGSAPWAAPGAPAAPAAPAKGRSPEGGIPQPRDCR